MGIHQRISVRHMRAWNQFGDIKVKVPVQEIQLVDAHGDEVDVSALRVIVSIKPEDITMSDDEEAGVVKGHIINLIYKGDHYRYIVRTEENEEDYVLSCPDMWNTGDLVGIIIPEGKIKLTLKPEVEE